MKGTYDDYDVIYDNGIGGPCSSPTHSQKRGVKEQMIGRNVKGPSDQHPRDPESYIRSRSSFLTSPYRILQTPNAEA